MEWWNTCNRGSDGWGLVLLGVWKSILVCGVSGDFELGVALASCAVSGVLVSAGVLGPESCGREIWAWHLFSAHNLCYILKKGIGFIPSPSPAVVSTLGFFSDIT
jgi:hypothetical protein